jgi:hypothetical protein
VLGELVGEGSDGADGVGAGLGVVDPGDRGLGSGLDPFGERGDDVGGLVDLMPNSA